MQKSQNVRIADVTDQVAIRTLKMGIAAEVLDNFAAKEGKEVDWVQQVILNEGQTPITLLVEGTALQARPRRYRCHFDGNRLGVAEVIVSFTYEDRMWFVVLNAIHLNRWGSKKDAKGLSRITLDPPWKI